MATIKYHIHYYIHSLYGWSCNFFGVIVVYSLNLGKLPGHFSCKRPGYKASMKVASYPGSRWARKEKAWYPLFAHVLIFPRNLGKSETIVLYPYNRDDIMYTSSYCYIVRTLSDKQWKRFDRLFSCALLRPPAPSDG